MATRVAEWLNELLQARDAGLRRNARRAPQLVLLKHQVVEEAFQETWIRLVSGGALGRRRVDVAFRHGLEAGNRIGLDRPVSGTDLGFLA